MVSIDILSAVPHLIESYFKGSILKRAIDKKIVNINLINIREYAINKSRTIDDYAFGGEAGMVLCIEPIVKAIEDLKSKKQYDEIIFFSPEAVVLNQKMLNYYALKKNFLLLCGHYKGIDQRIRDHYITKEISLGHFVLSGGELPAAVFTDGIVRLIPGVLNDESSALFDSFQDDIIAPPVYTRPANFNGLTVPEVLLKGNPHHIEIWKNQHSEEKTKQFQKRMKNRVTFFNYWY